MLLGKRIAFFVLSMFVIESLSLFGSVDSTLTGFTQADNLFHKHNIFQCCSHVLELELESDEESESDSLKSQNKQASYYLTSLLDLNLEPASITGLLNVVHGIPLRMSLIYKFHPSHAPPVFVINS